MLTNEQISDLADQHSNSGAQRVAAEAALKAAMQLLPDIAQRQGQAPDVTHGEAIPAAPVVIAVSSTEVTKPQEAEMWKRLDKALALYGRVEIVTFGERGNEINAHAWAKARDMPVREFGAAWTIVKPDGSTKRDTNARSTRDRKLKAYLAKAEQVFVLCWVNEDDRNARRVNALAAKILQWHPLKKRAPAPPREEPMDLSHPGSTETVVENDGDAEEAARLAAEYEAQEAIS